MFEIEENDLNRLQLPRTPNQRILLIEHTCTEFISSRLKLGVFLKNNGFEVFALLPEGGSATQYETIEAAGVQVLTYPYKRNGRSLIVFLKTIHLFRKKFRQYQFDLIHSFKFQPNFYSCIASLFLKRTKLVLHITGLGIVFTDKKTIKLRLLKWVSQVIFCFNFLVADRIIFQNKEDQSSLWGLSFFQKKYALVEGSGVDIEKFNKHQYNQSLIRNKLNIAENQLVITFVSRLIWQKGIKELVDAIDLLAKKLPNLRTLIIGQRDVHNPESVSEAFINQYTSNPNITFLGRRSDVAELLAISDSYVFPSYYREGVPRSLLEALATGLPIITTYMPGCNLCVNEEKNGRLVAPKSTTDLAQAIYQVMTNGKVNEMGKESRLLAEKRFQNKLIYHKILMNYPVQRASRI